MHRGCCLTQHYWFISSRFLFPHRKRLLNFGAKTASDAVGIYNVVKSNLLSIVKSLCFFLSFSRVGKRQAFGIPQRRNWTVQSLCSLPTAQPEVRRVAKANEIVAAENVKRVVNRNGRGPYPGNHLSDRQEGVLHCNPARFAVFLQISFTLQDFSVCVWRLNITFRTGGCFSLILSV